MATTHAVSERTGAQVDDARWNELADGLGVARRPAPLRRWVQSPNAGHLSGLLWGAPKPDIVFVHDLGDSSNGWDAVAIASGRDVVALDLAGHGHSSAAKSIASPARQAPALIDAIRSLAPTAVLVVASGFGAAVAIHAAVKRPATIRALIVIDGGTVASGVGPPVHDAGFERLDDVIQHIARVAPRRNPAFVRHLAAESTVVNTSGRREWRYQLGALPSEAEPWLDVGQFGDLPVPLAVVTATTTLPVDPVVRSIVDRWPSVRRLVIDGPTDDLIGGSPSSVAQAIITYRSELDSNAASELKGASAP